MPTLGQRFSSQLVKALHRYESDLKALSEEARSQSPGGVARSPYDFTYEVAVVFDRMAKRIKGLPVDPPSGDWMKAPAEFTNLENAVSHLHNSGTAFAELLDSLADDEFDREIAMGANPWTLFDIASMSVFHVNYHDGQLCYLQSILGDGEMHWG
jgi:hypothetical protein